MGVRRKEGRIAVRIAKSLLAILAALPLVARQPAFEVASVKVNRTGDNSSNYVRLTNGRLKATNVTLKTILQSAYVLGALQIEGPAWLESDRFDLEAKSPEGVPDNQMRPMLQSLLKERFQLAAHRESREMPVYDLIAAKSGLKAPLFDPEHIPPPPQRNGAASMIYGPFTMSQFAYAITPAAGRPVLDKTGIEGRYFCTMTYSPLAAESTDNTTGSGPLDFFAALEQQLGLKLESAKAPLPILIVDHAERVPTEN
jgi:uncharacterized protein (TIGR03435 family)